MIDVIAETVIIAFNEDNKQQQQVQKCWNKFVGRIVFLMQSGFKQRQLVEKNVDKKNNDKGANGNNF